VGSETDAGHWSPPLPGTEHIFLKYFPDLKTSVGYCNGNEEANNPNYRQVCAGTTGHAESVRIEFDPAKVSYEKLVGEFPAQVCVVRSRSDRQINPGSTSNPSTHRTTRTGLMIYATPRALLSHPRPYNSGSTGW
jgi:hypothetical protein